jgi:hypothetical protein
MKLHNMINLFLKLAPVYQFDRLQPVASVVVVGACMQANARIVQGGSNMTGTNCDLFTHNHSRSYLNDLVTQIRPRFFLYFLKAYL